MAKSQAKSKPLTIMILSGSTGRTAEEVLGAALAQFEDPNVRIVKRQKVRKVQDACEYVREAAEKKAIICHSLVSQKVRDAVLDEARHLLVPTVDILGRVLAVLSDHLGRSPRGEPGLAYKLQKEHFDRVEAVDFTLKHDDGCGLSSLRDADIVLVGVSRAAKSVTCFYLAYRGVRAANVPLILGHEVPKELVKMPKKKVIGLTISPARLQIVREARQEVLGAGEIEYYVDRNAVRKEVSHALTLMKKHGWTSIDVSYMAIEEVAARVLEMIGK